MIDAKVEVDLRGFNAAWDEYVKFNQRAIPEIITTKAYFVARNAVGHTKAADKEKIASDLMKASKLNSKSPVAAILVNRDRGIKGQVGLNGLKMQGAVERFIKRRQSFRNFLRAGWLPAVKKLASLVPSKRGAAKMPSGVRIKGQEKGGATPPAKFSWNPVCRIWNSVQGGKTPSEKVTREIEAGVQKAIDEEETSMREYVERKMEEGISKFNAS